VIAERPVAGGAGRHGAETVPRVEVAGDQTLGDEADALRGAGIDLDPRLLAIAPDDVGAAEAAVVAWRDGGGDFDAVVCASDSLALGAALALGKEQRRPPIPIVGFDNTPVSRVLGFSSVEQRTDLVAEAVLELLDARGETEDGAPPPHRLITPELVLRGDG
jgi:DNA-binding LacI/PurR family transcriptional regulator